VVIFSYTGSPQVKISQKNLRGGYFFLTHTVVSYAGTIPCKLSNDLYTVQYSDGHEFSSIKVQESHLTTVMQN